MRHIQIHISHIMRVVRAGWKNIYLHKLRSLLTALGIIFGVASVIAMLAIGEGASYEAREKIKELGSNNIIVKAVKPPTPPGTQQTVMLPVYGLTPVDIRRIEIIPSVETVVPTWEDKRDVWHLEKSISARIVGTYPEYLSVMNLQVVKGRFFNEMDTELIKPYVVIGSSVKNQLFPLEEAVGKTIRIGSNYFTVIGVAGEKAVTSGVGFEAEDINFDVYMPLTTQRIYYGEYTVGKRTGVGIRGLEREWVKYHRFIIKVKDMDQIITTAAIVEDILKREHKQQDYEILVPLQLLKQAEHTARIFNIVLGSIAAISLIVGGIGIMNIMLATVTERTREIGIRRALGAKRKDIIKQFLTEAVILSSIGGFIGIVLGVVIPKVVTKFAGMTTILTPWSIILAFSISVAVGISFGIYPARKAAYLDPIQALRYE
ncbi:MAG TPA: ABC transporter permease [bacterium]|nr:ABC transporter permease [bacterium]HPP29456.1 ABC transporter permease [bacterium]